MDVFLKDMAKKPKAEKTEDEKREDEILRRMLSTPPTPHMAKDKIVPSKRKKGETDSEC